MIGQQKQALQKFARLALMGPPPDTPKRSTPPNTCLLINLKKTLVTGVSKPALRHLFFHPRLMPKITFTAVGPAAIFFSSPA
mmetsp:Transcript_9642/g.17542  ORF Transcript_9642/g.17542 Transcript_9642/m.17542 type:complete len:82 (+) Transcript_9642:1009-1254(+)